MVKRPSRQRLLLSVLMGIATFLYLEREDLDVLVIAPLQSGSWTLVDRQADGFSVAVPASWREIPIDVKKMDAQATQTAKDNPGLAASPPPSQTIKYHAYDGAVASRGGGTIEIGSYPLTSDLTLDRVVEADLSNLEGVSNFTKPIVHRRVQLNAGPAEELSVQMTATGSDRSTFTGSLRMYVFVKGRTEYFLVLGAGPDRFSDYAPVFDKIANSFSWW